MKKRGSCKTWKFPAQKLQLVLVVPFVLQVFGAVAIVGYLSFKNGQRAVNELVLNLESQVGKQIDQHLENYLSSTRKLNELNATTISSGLINPNDLDGLGRFFWKQAKLYNVGYILFGSTNGKYVDVGRPLTYPVELITERIDPSEFGNQNLHIYEPDAQGNRGRLLDKDSGYPFQKESWYTEVMQTGKPLWSSVYTWQSEAANPLAISISSPVYDKNKKIIGAIAVEQRLGQISSFLRDLDISDSGQVFILERNGLLVASSGTEPLSRLVNQKPQRLKAINSPNSIVQGVSIQLQQRLSNFASITTAQELQLDLQGERYYVRVTPWRDPYGLDWLVVVSLPEREFMAQIDANTRTTVWLCLAALGVASILGIFTSQWITRPISRLNRASQAMASGNLDQTVEESGIQEINALANSFNYMSGQLRESFTALASSNEELEDRVEDRTTELKNALTELQRTQAQMLQSEKMSSLGQLVAGIAHEINNPVNFIYGNLGYAQKYIRDLLGFLQLYQQHDPHPVPEVKTAAEAIDLEFLQADLPKILSSMQVGTDRIRQIVLSLRNFSRMDEAEIKRVNIHEGIDSTLLILQHRLKAHSHRPEIEVIKNYGDLPLVECYAGQLNQVFMNILVNAIDALEELPEINNPSQIEISTVVVDEKWIQIAIADNGPGIPKDVQARIFNPFFTTKPVGKGTGMGMSISYQIITERHRGKLECLSHSGEGTQFIIHIPSQLN
ncbi:ATP-binding protein [Trichocoleus sp. FACHB-262]|uniref:sensor histidine kinase n=1 Tax=Trichocoleus sp. FACHB-262 TaxID=2692869 RepID=UPI0016893C7A|nr:ATP-binding protein [Trichocoleus sp. FACHB-262]MBD2120810.1 HAMP domain-containing protein [Trichocoleus sp. FACHB-262]